MTLVINLFGGPGSGKSTTAAAIFAALKNRGVRAELVREYVKGWAWEGKAVGRYDQPYICAKQMKEEARLYGKVDVIVTDSPLWLQAYYAEKYAQHLRVTDMIRSFTESASLEGVRQVNYLVIRTKEYDAHGRYETEAQARTIDHEQRAFFEEKGLPLIEAHSSELVDLAVAGLLDGK